MTLLDFIPLAWLAVTIMVVAACRAAAYSEPPAAPTGLAQHPE
jgi:hypothetical protein